jgi:MOSC domain-containing protein YiiM
MSTSGKILSVNVGRPRKFVYNGRAAKSAIWKFRVVERIVARGVNLDGDDQADRSVHGGPDKAVYAYAVEDLCWWERRLRRSLAYGHFGETLNLSEGRRLQTHLRFTKRQTADVYTSHPQQGT